MNIDLTPSNMMNICKLSNLTNFNMTLPSQLNSSGKKSMILLNSTQVVDGINQLSKMDKIVKDSQTEIEFHRISMFDSRFIMIFEMADYELLSMVSNKIDPTLNHTNKQIINCFCKNTIKLLVNEKSIKAINESKLIQKQINHLKISTERISLSIHQKILIINCENLQNSLLLLSKIKALEIDNKLNVLALTKHAVPLEMMKNETIEITPKTTIPNNEQFFEILTLSSKQITFLIGKNGKKIQSLRKMTNCQIKVISLSRQPLKELNSQDQHLRIIAKSKKELDNCLETISKELLVYSLQLPYYHKR